MRWRLSTIVVVLSVLVFVLPLLALVGLRVYDRQLVRQTEAELIAQGSVIAAAFKEQVHDDDYGVAAQVEPGPLAAHLDAALDRVRPRAADSEIADRPADPVAAMAGRAIETLLYATKAVTLAGIRVVDVHGIVVASTGTEHGESVMHREEVQRALRGEASSLLRERHSSSPVPDLASQSREAGWRVFVALPVLDGTRVLGAVVLSRTPITLKKALWEDRVFVGSWMLVMMTLVIVVALYLTATIVSPVRRLVQVSNAIAADEPVQPTGRRVPEELAELERALLAMAATLAARTQYIKTFAAAVSHEFKTPLTAMRGAVELLLDHDMSAEQRHKFHTQLQTNVLYLDRLVSRLLELARADTARPTDATCQVQRVVASAPADLRVAMNEETLATIVSNLVDNARHHAPGAAVSVSAEHAGERVRLVVEDNGPGVSEGNAARIFQPFFTTNRAGGGTGLGLNIVKTLVEAHGGSIRFEPGNPGARFVIEL